MSRTRAGHHLALVAPRLAHYQGRLTGGAAPLDEMTKSTDTRFVIITHNPITMARMNRLYGVTMAERGVSQLVSVDLEAAVRIRDEAVA